MSVRARWGIGYLRNEVVVESFSCRMDEKTFSYRNLIVWQKAMELVKAVSEHSEHSNVSMKTL